LGGVIKACSKYSGATVWGPLGATSKLKTVPWQKQLGKDRWPYQDTLALVALNGMPAVNESVFVHLPSKTLIVADLCFNMTDSKGIGARIIFGLFGTYRKIGISRFFASHIKDKQAFRSSIEKLIQYDFENIVVSHGENLVGQAKTKLLDCLRERNLI
jgi:hypothetical protein